MCYYIFLHTDGMFIIYNENTYVKIFLNLNLNIENVVIRCKIKKQIMIMIGKNKGE